ncbi:TVP38/TMEM64 family protein [Deinococcus ruber]|uniref:TVP38/TMEM64 family protein n=1 Tax=Deinococcus ruber TaxID=1848197 RepID=UPI001E4B5D7E|nr:VTT domain-containing protein [Deinococcus ruber]
MTHVARTRWRPPAWAWWVLGLAVLLGLISVPQVRGFLLDAWHALSNDDPAVRRAWVNRFGVWGPLALIAGMLVQAALPLLPATADVMIASLAYGPYVGFAIVYVGTLLGAVLGYALGRAAGGRLIRRLAGETLSARTEAFARQRGWKAVLMIRLMPALKAEVMNLVAGAVGIPFGPFLLASALGALPATALVVWLAASPSRLVWGVVLFSAATGVVLLVRWVLARRAVGREL